jgi:hypothetical protein
MLSVNKFYLRFVYIIKMMYKTRMLMDYIHRLVFSIDHDVSETGPVSVLRWM